MQEADNTQKKIRLEGVKLVEQINPDIVLLDLDMPTMNGREALAQILAVAPQMAVLMLTVSEDGDDLAECMRLGARGYLLKKIDAAFLLQSIRHAVAGDSVISPEMTNKLVMKLRRDSYHSAAVAPDIESLTPRERKVLSLRFGLQDGYSRTLEEVGKQFNVTRERIRQIEAKALRKMRHPTRIRQLQGFFEAEINTAGPGFDHFKKANQGEK